MGLIIVTSLLTLLCGLHEQICVKRLEQCLARPKRYWVLLLLSTADGTQNKEVFT